MFDLHTGDCLEVMPELQADSVDAIVTDPPYGLGFMGKDWDHGVPGVAFWREALRVAKPGTHMLAFGGTRTFHRLMVAIEDAGWEIRDTIMWVYGSGFPKSLDVGKAIDKVAGVEREVIGKQRLTGTARGHAAARTTAAESYEILRTETDITTPTTPEAVQWDGWGTAMKPAWEPIIVARKPLEGTVVANVLKYGTGALNIDASRIESGDDTSRKPAKSEGLVYAQDTYSKNARWGGRGSNQGRWPANLIHDGSDDVLEGFPESSSANSSASSISSSGVPGIVGFMPSRVRMDAKLGYGDTGSVTRFFYCPKADATDRDEGLDGPVLTPGSVTDREDGTAGLESPRAGAGRTRGGRNNHPTVKPFDLMRYLCTLITPPGGVILDPFMDSGSTGKAAVLSGFRFVGIDLMPEYVELSRQRIGHAEYQFRGGPFATTEQVCEIIGCDEVPAKTASGWLCPEHAEILT